MRFLFQIASQVSEFYIGGDETQFLIQVLAGPAEDQRDIDVMATVLVPSKETDASPSDASSHGVRYCFTCRGEDALLLCSSFMEAHPESPVLTQKSDGSFAHVVCCLEGQDPWGRSPVSLRALQTRMQAGSEYEKIHFFLPAPERQVPSPPENRVSLERFPHRPSIALD